MIIREKTWNHIANFYLNMQFLHIWFAN